MREGYLHTKIKSYYNINIITHTHIESTENVSVSSSVEPVSPCVGAVSTGVRAVFPGVEAMFTGVGAMSQGVGAMSQGVGAMSQGVGAMSPGGIAQFSITSSSLSSVVTSSCSESFRDKFLLRNRMLTWLGHLIYLV